MRALVALPLLDELTGGLSVAAAPSLARDTGAGTLSLGAALLVAPMLSSFLEAPILAWTDRHRAARRFLVAGGIAGMAASVAILSVASTAVGLAVGSAVYGTMSGLALGTAEAALVDGAGDDAPRRLARWSLFGSLGDVLAPLIVALTAAAGVSWRSSFQWSAAVLGVVAAASLAWSPGDALPHEDEEDALPVAASLRAALTNRRLLGWLLGAAMCMLLDELLAVYAALWVTERFSLAMAAPTLVLFSTGGAVGSAVLERALSRHQPLTLLTVSSAACAVAFVGWLVAPTWEVALACSFALGAFATALHPLAKAEAFAALPARPGLVNGASQAFVLVDLLAPILLGLFAERHGLRAALALLVLQPLWLLCLAELHRRRRRGTQ